MAPKEEKLKEPKEDQKLKTGAAVAAVAAAGALIWGVSRYFSSSSNDEGEKPEMMRAPGRPNEYICRDNFVNNPQQYFSKLHEEERQKRSHN
ncbi:hypothetical protein IEQ34_003164 [Dendrobium chrysotoxum]|uniref:Uncharacterized protein n=1 Tax=Dendrobium chrysotoxum TaxID=161865 RepID=A0AAV7HGI4_DENCH|nr:hypothetical protein IEQ34_003164 [Dendrobium chrysotoxum]